jgi:hypothetical protein
VTLRLPGEGDGEFLDRIDAAWYMRQRNNREGTMSFVNDDLPQAAPSTPEQVALEALRAQVKAIEDAKAADHRKRQLLEEAEGIRKQLRSYGITPVA